MNWVRKLTVSRSFSVLILLLAVLGFAVPVLSCGAAWAWNTKLFVFAVGALAAYPPIHGAWSDIKKHWDREIGDTGKTYRDFFTGDADREERTALVKHHWSSISWTIPYAFSVYLYLSFSSIYFFGFRSLALLFAGSLFSISLESLRFQDGLDLNSE